MGGADVENVPKVARGRTVLEPDRELDGIPLDAVSAGAGPAKL